METSDIYKDYDYEYAKIKKLSDLVVAKEHVEKEIQNKIIKYKIYKYKITKTLL